MASENLLMGLLAGFLVDPAIRYMVNVLVYENGPFGLLEKIRRFFVDPMCRFTDRPELALARIFVLVTLSFSVFVNPYFSALIIILGLSALANPEEF